MSQLRGRLSSVFELDLRSLALFRVSVAALLVLDLILRFPQIAMFYTDGSVTPRSAGLDLFPEPGMWSLHYATGSEFGQTLLFGIALVFALGMMAGWRTRLCTVLSWILLTSLHHRSGLVLYGGDGLLRLLVFWGMFLPLGARFSVDEALDPDDAPRRSVLSMGSAAYVIQVCSVYLWTVGVKYHPTWFSQGTATYYALSLDLFSTEFARTLLAYPTLMKASTWATLAWEILGTCLVLVPWRRDALRSAAVVGFLLFHGVLLASTMKLAQFPLISIAMWLAIIPGTFWDRLHSRWATPERTGWRIYYDGDCGFCRKTVRILRSFLWLKTTPVLPAQDEPEIAELMEQENSWIVVDHEGKQHLRFEAIIVAVSYAPVVGWTSRLLSTGPVSRLGDVMYRWVADHRAWMGQLTRPLVWRPVSVSPSRLGSLVALVTLVYVTMWNYGTTSFPESKKLMPKEIRSVGFALGLDQYWNLFAPFPSKEDGWFVFPAKLKDGTEGDLFRDLEPVSWDPPEDRRGEFSSQREFSYLINIWRRKYKAHRIHYGRYLCREWDKRLPEERSLETFEMHFVLEKTPPPGVRGKTKPILIWQHDCRDKPDEGIEPWKKGRRKRLRK